MKPPALISMCLCGVPCRYHGKTHKMGYRLYREKLVQKLKEEYELIPLCPEQLGGLPVPRCACAVTWEGDIPTVVERATGKVRYQDHDLTAAYLDGARWSVWLADVFGAKKAFMLKQSPACDSKDGVAARALAAHGVYVKGV
jgi:uncharacterized protein YbbK (DUF523 family)